MPGHVDEARLVPIKFKLVAIHVSLFTVSCSAYAAELPDVT